MSAINIEVIDVTIQKQGDYQKMNVTHKLQLGSQWKTDAKALVSFATPPAVWATLSKAQKGDLFVINREKDAKEGKYWQWVGIESPNGEQPVTEAAVDYVVPTPTKVAAPTKSNAFVDLDARKQRLIVRQSCLAQAVNYVGKQVAETDEGLDYELSDVLAVADKFVEWVLKGE